MKKVILEGFIEVPEDDYDQVVGELPAHIALTRQEAGCLVFRVEKDKSNPRRFKVYEEFVNKAAFEAHQTRVEASRWGKVTVNVHRDYRITGI